MPAVMPSASLENIEKALEIGIGIGMLMFDRIAHASLGCQMDDRRKPVLRKQLADRPTVRQIHLHETELRMPEQHIQPRPFQGGVLVIV
jgi:hypothetical protein